MTVEQIIQFVLSNPTSIATLILASITTLSVMEYSRGSIRQSIATAEPSIMPKMYPNIQPPDTHDIITFEFVENRPQSYDVSVVENEGDGLPTEIDPGDQLYSKWTVHFLEQSFHDFLRQLPNQPANNVNFVVEYQSVSGREYRYEYEVEFSVMEFESENHYEATGFDLTNSVVPWERVALSESVIGLKSFTSDDDN